MPLIQIILSIAVIGFICYLITMIPMPPIFRTIIYGVIIIFAIYYLMSFAGLGTFTVPVRHR